MRKKNYLQFKPIVILFLIISTIILLVYSLGVKGSSAFIKYFSYLYSAFSLVVVFGNVKRFYFYIKEKFLKNKIYKNIRDTLYKNRYVKKYFEDIRFRNLVNLCLSLVINFTFIFIKFINGIRNKSVWFISLALYYFLLIIIKVVLLNNLRKYDKIQEYRVYRTVGCFLMILNIILVIMIIQMVRSNVAVVYGGYIVYITAMYTFYLIISATINVVKYRKYNSPILSSVKAINLLTASVSILMLQTTMIATFGENNLDFMRRMNTITGTVISLITLGISTYMILKGQRQLKRLV